ncbi:hypothetical protein Dimus_028354 [Dionaea muscipula]
MAILKGNGLGVKDKQLKVKYAAYGRKSRDMSRTNIRYDTKEQPRLRTRWVPKFNISGSQAYADKLSKGPVHGHSGSCEDQVVNVQGRKIKTTDASKYAASYATVIKRGGQLNDSIPVLRGIPIGNGWLYRSIVATFGDHRNSESLLGSFTDQHKGEVIVRRLGPKTILITLLLRKRGLAELLRNTSARLEYKYVLSHRSTLGEVLQVEDDIANYTRCDIGKVKISTSIPSAINHQMKLVVGWKTFVIRIAEEQSTFICNSNFSCGCLCHRREDEQISSVGLEGDDDDVDRSIENRISEVEEDNSRLLIAGSRDDINNNNDCDARSKSLGELEMRGNTDPVSELPQVVTNRGLEATQEVMSGGIGDIGRVGGAVGVYGQQEDGAARASPVVIRFTAESEAAEELIIGGKKMGNVLERVITGMPLNGDRDCLQRQSSGPLYNDGILQDKFGLRTEGPGEKDRDGMDSSIIRPSVGYIRDVVGPVHNPVGINLEVVLVGPTGPTIGVGNEPLLLSNECER